MVNWIYDCEAVTPIERRGLCWAKRDDLYVCGKARGGKCRAAFKMALKAKNERSGLIMHGACRGVVTYGSRTSPQGAYTSIAAASISVPCIYVTSHGADTSEIEITRNAGADVRRVKPGYLSQCKSVARHLAGEHGWEFVPLSMESSVAVSSTRAQVLGIPEEVKRIVMVVGGGVSVSAVLWGLGDLGRDIPILGVQIGRPPHSIIDKWAPVGWRRLLTIVKSEVPYDRPVNNIWEGVFVDPYYEGKCIPYIESGDLFWIVGIRPGIDPLEQSWWKEEHDAKDESLIDCSAIPHN